MSDTVSQNQPETSVPPVSSILIPIDTLEAYQRLLPVVGTLISGRQVQSFEKIRLLHVIEGSFLSGYMDTIDISSGEVPPPSELKKLRGQHLENYVNPLMHQAKELLSEVVKGEAELEIIDGDPVKTIVEVCQNDQFSSLVMSRRNLAEITQKLTGSVVSGVLHRHVNATMYLIGDEPLPPSTSPFARCLIGVDGSPASISAVHEAGALLVGRENEIEKILLVHVLDQSCYYDEDGLSCMQASEAGQQALEVAGNMLLEAGVEPSKLTTVIHFGKPGTVLAEEAMAFDATLIFIGRRDRSRMAQVFLGSVCTDMIQHCRERTIILPR
ncbi:MAG: hypothetical protein D6B25_15455 [Desulfobulbaceae bacterium]|nr:MAG: hypothetical protein D6B25_15455 [Desulfobulbaceae bacterium]